MECYECKNSIYCQAFSTGNCEKCNEEIHSAHMPCAKLCKECADKYMLCEQCANAIALSRSEFKRIKIMCGEEV